MLPAIDFSNPKFKFGAEHLMLFQNNLGSIWVESIQNVLQFRDEIEGAMVEYCEEYFGVKTTETWLPKYIKLFETLRQVDFEWPPDAAYVILYSERINRLKESASQHFTIDLPSFSFSKENRKKLQAHSKADSIDQATEDGLVNCSAVYSALNASLYESYIFLCGLIVRPQAVSSEEKQPLMRVIRSSHVSDLDSIDDTRVSPIALLEHPRISKKSDAQLNKELVSFMGAVRDVYQGNQAPKYPKNDFKTQALDGKVSIGDAFPWQMRVMLYRVIKMDNGTLLWNDTLWQKVPEDKNLFKGSQSFVLSPKLNPKVKPSKSYFNQLVKLGVRFSVLEEKLVDDSADTVNTVYDQFLGLWEAKSRISVVVHVKGLEPLWTDEQVEEMRVERQKVKEPAPPKLSKFVSGTGRVKLPAPFTLRRKK